MALRSPRLGLLVACLVWAACLAPARAAPPSTAEMLKIRPAIEEIVCTTPSAEEQGQCRIDPVVSGKKTIGWALVDGRKQMLRRVLDTNNDGQVDVWCFYKEGFEIYREIDTNFNGKADQFRWFNDGGMKWGVDANEDGKIDGWRMISAEEVGLEIFRALAARDFERLRPLFITEAEMRALKMAPAQMERIKAQIAKAPAVFRETYDKVKLDPRAQFVRVESVAPSCQPGDSIGMDSDLIRFPSRSILFEIPTEKRHDWIQSGEMIQVGLSWRLIEAPGGEVVDTGGGNQGNPELTKLFQELDTIDKSGPPILAATNAADAERMMRRANVVEKILSLVDPAQRETWIKQLLDNLGAAAYALDKFPSDKNASAAMSRLGQLKNQLEKSLPGSNLAGYATYRELCAIHLARLANTITPATVGKAQEEWHDKLSKFVQTYPNVDDTPDALQQLGIGSEFAGKDEEAKRWYAQIFTNFPTNQLADKAKGCVRRLTSVGQEMELASPTLENTPFDIKELRGKVVAVYYWASYCQACPREFAMLKQIHTSLAAKGVELVCVNLDDKAQDATRFVQSNPLRAIHLFQQATSGGGLNSPLATHYGINGLPTVFVVGRDGKVLNRTLQVNDLEDALKKAL